MNFLYCSISILVWYPALDSLLLDYQNWTTHNTKNLMLLFIFLLIFDYFNLLIHIHSLILKTSHQINHPFFTLYFYSNLYHPSNYFFISQVFITILCLLSSKKIRYSTQFLTIVKWISALYLHFLWYKFYDFLKIFRKLICDLYQKAKLLHS